MLMRSGRALAVVRRHSGQHTLMKRPLRRLRSTTGTGSRVLPHRHQGRSGWLMRCLSDLERVEYTLGLTIESEKVDEWQRVYESPERA
jgi:hypothetical protein